MLSGRLLALSAAATLAASALLVPSSAVAAPPPLPLPAGFQPEGIATDGLGSAYLGSRVDGDIYRLDLRTGAGQVISEGPGTPSLGLKVDDDRLWVAGGSGGDARVVDLRTGDVVRSYDLVPEGTTSFVNDVVLTDKAAWFTDSLNATIHKVRIGGAGRPGKLVSKPLTGAWTQTPGVNNANGITTTPDGKALLVVNSSTGQLHRVERSGRTTVVNLRGYTLTAGDGLLREGRTLYAVQNRQNQIAVLRLSRSGRIVTLTRQLTSPGFDVPSTVARWRNRLYLPNARFTTPPTPTTPYAVTSVRDLP